MTTQFEAMRAYILALAGTGVPRRRCVMAGSGVPLEPAEEPARSSAWPRDDRERDAAGYPTRGRDPSEGSQPSARTLH